MAPVRSRCSRPQPGARDPTRPDRRHVTGGQPASTGHWPDTRLTAGSQSASRATIPAALSRPAKHRSSRSGSTPAAKATGRLPRIRRVGARSLRPAPPLNVMSYIDLALPTIAPCNTPSGPDQRFGGCGAPRGTAERKARSGIWIRIAGSAPIGGKILPVPSPVAGPGARNVRARVPRRWQRFTALSGPGKVDHVAHGSLLHHQDHGTRGRRIGCGWQASG
jgi:hypothetical protein